MKRTWSARHCCVSAEMQPVIGTSDVACSAVCRVQPSWWGLISRCGEETPRTNDNHCLFWEPSWWLQAAIIMWEWEKSSQSASWYVHKIAENKIGFSKLYTSPALHWSLVGLWLRDIWCQKNLCMIDFTAPPPLQRRQRESTATREGLWSNALVGLCWTPSHSRLLSSCSKAS